MSDYYILYYILLVRFRGHVFKVKSSHFKSCQLVTLYAQQCPAALLSHSSSCWDGWGTGLLRIKYQPVQQYTSDLKQHFIFFILTFTFTDKDTWTLSAINKALVQPLQSEDLNIAVCSVRRLQLWVRHTPNASLSWEQLILIICCNAVLFYAWKQGICQ